MSRLAFMILILLCVVGFSAYKILIQDDELNPVAEKWVIESSAITSSNNPAFYFLEGMRATSEADIRDLAEYKLSLSNTAADNYFADNDADTVDEHNIPLLEMPDDSEICSIKEYDCYQQMTEIPTQEINSLLNKYQVLLERHDRFFEYGQYKSLYKPHLVSNFPNFSTLKIGQSLYSLQLILDARLMGCPTALGKAKDYLNVLRVNLAESDTLFSKMLLARMVSDHLELIGLIMQNDCLELGNGAYQLRTLSNDELSMLKPYKHEFVTIFNSTNGLVNQKNFLSKNHWTPKWIAKLIYKPNRTNNTIQNYFQRLSEYSPTVSFDGSKCIELGNSKKALSGVTNYIGNFFVRMGVDSYCRYSLRMRLLDTKVALVNYIITGDLAVLINPHYSSLTPSYDDKTRQLCLLMPKFDQRREFQCVFLDDRLLELPDITPGVSS